MGCGCASRKANMSQVAPSATKASEISYVVYGKGDAGETVYGRFTNVNEAFARKNELTQQGTMVTIRREVST